MSLTVLNIAYPFAPVGPRAVGGAEQVLTWLEDAVHQQGHRSLVAARADSQVCGQLFPTPAPDGPLTPEAQESVTRAHQASIDCALRSGPVNLIHMHGIDFHRYILPRDVPVLVTLHLPPSWYPETIWTLPARYYLLCVSESQRRACPLATQERLSVIENGVPMPERAVRKAPYALLLARICPEKNLHAGLDAARLAGVPAVLAGETFPYPDHLAYFEQEIKPRLSYDAAYAGLVGGARKQAMLAEARCLLLPTLAPETSSLTAMEALAAGTPVIAYPSGAIPEIVEHGRTGFLVNTVEEMAAAIARVDEIDPKVCRDAAHERFPLSRMTARYLDLYERLASA